MIYYILSPVNCNIKDKYYSEQFAMRYSKT